MDSAYARIGAKLIDQGLCAIPIAPGTQMPGDYTGNWFIMPEWTTKYLDHLPTDEEVYGWERAPDAGVCVLLGKASRGLVCVDVDVNSAVDAVVAALPHTPVRKFGSKGVSLFFWYPYGTCKARSFKNGAGITLVDLLGQGRQTILPPTIHAKIGTPYKWVGEIALEDAQDSDIPDLPENVFEILENVLRPFGYHKEQARAGKKSLDRSSDLDPYSKINKLAFSNLDAWVPALDLYNCKREPSGKYCAVATWRNSSTGRPLEQRARHLSIHPDGAVDFGSNETFSAIDLVIKSGVASDHDKAYCWLSDRLEPKSAVVIKLRPVQDNIEDSYATVEPVVASTLDFFKVEYDEEDLEPWARNVEFENCPGLIGQISDYIQSSAISPQPYLAIGAALTLVAAISGRKYKGPTGLNTHLFVCGIAPSGAGKDTPLNVSKNILDDCKLSPLITEKPRSDAAFYTRLIDTPCCVMHLDEFGNFLKKVLGSRNSFELGISGVLRSLYSRNYGILKEPDGALKPGRSIYAPTMSVLGMTTPEEFYAAVSGGDVQNGLLNRFVFLHGVERPDRNFIGSPGKTPQEIIDTIKQIYWVHGTLESATSHNAKGDTPFGGKVIQVEWQDKAKDRHFQTFDAEQEWRLNNKDSASFIGRVSENALRIATLRAITHDYKNPKITLADYLWGEKISKLSAYRLVFEFTDNNAVNDRQMWRNRILDIVKKKGPDGVKIADIQRSLKSAIKSQDIREIMEDLVVGRYIYEKRSVDKRSNKDSVRTFFADSA
ncbi:MAG: DUF3987 domain-containing protein [Methylocystaceae bacterium]|jgi:Bifunctional DNA primase/polymerase, N-terminal/Protein of unknown function (DUF3987)|nr:DUF3987 domain-containing protein [Methylocystaceae bacterium]NBT96966.1 DUF3987 domain-containing protein [Methylocystaceae bacterium]